MRNIIWLICLILIVFLFCFKLNENDKEINALNLRISSLEDDINQIKSDQSSSGIEDLRGSISETQDELKSAKADIDDVGGAASELKTDLDDVKDQISQIKEKLDIQ